MGPDIQCRRTFARDNNDPGLQLTAVAGHRLADLPLGPGSSARAA
jgi:hypothetical protein